MHTGSSVLLVQNPTGVLIPNGAEDCRRCCDKREGLQGVKCLTVILLVLTIGLSIVTGFFVFKYEDRMVGYEHRITELELDLETFFHILNEELEYDHSRSVPPNQKPLSVSNRNHQTPSGTVISDETDQIKLRRKRQIQFPNLPNSFGPEVERTEEGVPIVDRSYQISSSGSSSQRNYASSYPARVVVPPTPDSEGLRLYEGLVETGGRNEPKSPDFFANDGENGLLPHHKVSAAWSEKTSPASQRSSGLQLRSGDGSGFGIDDSRSGGPRFAQELTYTRSSSGSHRQSNRLRSTPSPQRQPAYQHPYNSNVFVSGGSAATFHRNSRVAATGDQYYPTTRRTPSAGRNSRVEYPPLRRLSLGDGNGEVIARVVQTNDDDNSTPVNFQRRTGRRGGERKSGTSGINRRERQGEYLSRRPVETYRTTTTTTESPQGYSEGEGRLNVTIRKSAPFGTYYSSSRGNWEINTSPPTQRNYY